MTNELHCSACDALIPSGSQFCPGCGLQLMAQAVPAVYVTGPRFSFGAVALLAIVGFIAICYLASALDERKAKITQAALLADLQAGGAMATPEAFQASCGEATTTKTTAAGVELHYSANDIVIDFPPHAAPTFAQRVDFRNDLGKPDSFDRPVSAEYALRHILCAKK